MCETFLRLARNCLTASRIGPKLEPHPSINSSPPPASPKISMGGSSRAMPEAGRAGHRPRPRHRFGVAGVRHEAVGIGAKLDLDFGQLAHVGYQPWLGAIGELPVGEQDDGGHVL